jgi:hypothetical protein
MKIITKKESLVLPKLGSNKKTKFLTHTTLRPPSKKKQKRKKNNKKIDFLASA